MAATVHNIYYRMLKVSKNMQPKPDPLGVSIAAVLCGYLLFLILIAVYNYYSDDIQLMLIGVVDTITGTRQL